MEIAVGVSRTVRRNQKIRSIKVWRAYGNELDLTRPLRKLGRNGTDRTDCDFGCITPDCLCPRTGTSAAVTVTAVRRRFCALLPFPGSPYCPFIVCRRFPFFKRNGSRRTSGQTVAETVAVVLACENCSTVDHFDRTFMTSRSTCAAAIAFFSVDMNDFSYHIHSSPKSGFLFY